MVQERRALERFDLQIPARLHIISEGDGTQDAPALQLITSNISADGAFFLTREPLSRGTAVDVGLDLTVARPNSSTPRRSKIKVSGRVVRIEPNGIAVRFEPGYQIRPTMN
jgi:hypothetical protein